MAEGVQAKERITNNALMLPLPHLPGTFLGLLLSSGSVRFATGSGMIGPPSSKRTNFRALAAKTSASDAFSTRPRT